MCVCVSVTVHVHVCVKYKESSRNRCMRASKMNLIGTALLLKMLSAVSTLCSESGKSPTANTLHHTDALSAPRLAQLYKRRDLCNSVHLVTFALG